MDMSANDYAISCRDVTVSFGDHKVLDGLDIDVPRGALLGFVGASGAGKSVLMRTILGLVPRQGGTIDVLGVNLDESNEAERSRVEKEMGVLFQHGALFSSLNVRQNVQAPMREHLDLSQQLMDELADLKLAMVGLNPDAGDKFPSELSGGMIKRAALARALALDPKIVFLDEPTSGLDPIGAAEFDELIAKLSETLGLTVFMVTHDLDSLISTCTHIAALGGGKILVLGDPKTVMAFDDPWINRYFHGARARAVLGGVAAREQD
ncbi:MAG: ATP-binding cassette domain-containing protein [Rhodobiaceae bacterium]|nr:ATP-binding cassette domain-containing protein [Rhodobiaceae bacterium]MCC0055745.1 ATP-binding cassette domain-containing protein [Rhodobiaceae bacterium]